MYRNCGRLSAKKILIIQRIIKMEQQQNQQTCARSLGETGAKKTREIPDGNCPMAAVDNLEEAKLPPYVARMQQKIIELEKSANPASKMEAKVEEKDEAIVVFFDLETSGLDAGCDILQISLRSRDSHFSTFITPTKPIDEGASRVNNLYFRDGKLFKGDQQVETLPLDDVLQQMLEHLSSLKKKCLLVAHYCPFDSRHLLKKLQQNSTLFAKFENLLYGFADSYEMFAEKYPERRWVKGTLTLSKLVEESLGMSTANAHDAGVDTLLLQKLVQHNFTDAEIFEYRVTLAYALENRRNWSRRKRAF